VAVGRVTKLKCVWKLWVKQLIGKSVAHMVCVLKSGCRSRRRLILDMDTVVDDRDACLWTVEIDGVTDSWLYSA